MKKPTIVVVGLLPKQAREMEAVYGHKAKLRFIESQGDKPRLPNGDHCLLMVNFIRHLWSKAAWKQFPRTNVHYVRGGIGEAKRTIDLMFQGEQT